MGEFPKARWQAWLLLLALVASAAVPRTFVVCVSRDDHCSLEADFEAEPCEADFIFGAGNDASWPPADCTDIPAVQLSARTDAPPADFVVPPNAVAPPPLAPLVAFRHPTDGRPGVQRAETVDRVLRTTVLRL
jgi:hypothetical protein